MELRARTRPTLRRAGLLAALTALLVPAVAGTTANAKTRAPVVRSITPKNVYVGQTLTIRGHHFRRGLNKNTVAFKRAGARVMFVKAEKGTTKMLRVTLPKRLEKLLTVKNGTPTPTRLRVRVLSAMFGKSFTSRSKSPVVSPEKPPAPPKPPTVDPNADCDADGTVNRLDSDDDNDLLSDTQEKSISPLLDTCNPDTDGDGIEDGYEYESAVDLNNDEVETGGSVTPYPRKLPFPNPLDKTDANTDHDGDSLTLRNEYDLWKYTIAHGSPRSLHPLSYSAGKQYSVSLTAPNYFKNTQFLNWANGHNYGLVNLVNLGALQLDQDWNLVPDSAHPPANYVPYSITDFDRSGAVAPVWESEYYDRDHNNVLSDAERDEDADGLPNQWENTGCMTRGLWDALYNEAPYYLGVNDYGKLDMVDGDSDGDGVLDGADDQDHDGIPNIMECSRALATAPGTTFDPRDDTATHLDRPWKGFVNPFNPCLPLITSRTCKSIIEVGAGAKEWAPFEEKVDQYYHIWN
jgi:IPT/TIG domain-containing protein